MRPLEHVIATASGVDSTLGLPLHGGAVHATSLHVVVDSALGLVVGVALVALYLAALRRFGQANGDEQDQCADPPCRGGRSGDS